MVVAPSVLAIATFLSVTWGIYRLGTIDLYRKAAHTRTARVVALRKVIVAFCLWLLIFSFVFRTAMVLAGFGENATGQVVFFTLLGSNVLGSIFCAVSLWFD